MGSKSDFAETKFLGVLNGQTVTAPTAFYSALFTVAPSDSTAGTEVTNATSNYTRMITTFVTAGATVAGQIVNLTALVWATLAAGTTVVGWALMDAVTSGVGNQWYYTTVTTIVFASGDQPTIAALGGITVTED